MEDQAEHGPHIHLALCNAGDKVVDLHMDPDGNVTLWAKKDLTAPTWQSRCVDECRVVLSLYCPIRNPSIPCGQNWEAS